MRSACRGFGRAAPWSFRRRTGVDLKLLLDTVEQADALADVREATGVTPSVFIELDCDDHRGGLKPDDPKLLEVAGRVVAAGANTRRRPRPCRRILWLEHARCAGAGSRERAFGHRARRRDSARARSCLPDRQRRLDADRPFRRRIWTASPRCAQGSTCSSTSSSTGSGSARSTISRLRPGDRDRRQAGKGLDDGRRGVDGAFARPGNREPAARPGLRRGLRRQGAGASKM